MHKGRAGCRRGPCSSSMRCSSRVSIPVWSRTRKLSLHSAQCDHLQSGDQCTREVPVARKGPAALRSDASDHNVITYSPISVHAESAGYQRGLCSSSTCAAAGTPAHCHCLRRLNVALGPVSSPAVRLAGLRRMGCQRRPAAFVEVWRQGLQPN